MLDMGWPLSGGQAPPHKTSDERISGEHFSWPPQFQNEEARNYQQFGRPMFYELGVSGMEEKIVAYRLIESRIPQTRIVETFLPPTHPETLWIRQRLSVQGGHAYGGSFAAVGGCAKSNDRNDACASPLASGGHWPRLLEK